MRQLPLSPKQKRIAKWVGYVLLAILTFVFTLHLTFPYDRLKDRIIDSLSDRYEVDIVAVEPGFMPGNFTIKAMTLSTRPKTPEDKPVDIYFGEIDISIGITSAVFWTVDLAKIGIDVDANMSGGAIELALSHDKGDNTLLIDAKTSDLPLAVLPGVKDAVGLPMTGGLSAKLDVALPGGKWEAAEGSIEISCGGCTVGDGVAKLKMKPPPGRRVSKRALAFQGDGLTVPKINLGAVFGKLKIDEGVGVIEEFGAKSADGFLKIDGEIAFKSPFKETLFPGCIRFGFSEELKAREPKFMGIEAGLPPKAKQDDGSYALPTLGKLMNLRVNKRGTCAGAKGNIDEDSSGARTKPRITTTSSDDDPPKPRIMPEIKTAAELEEEDDDDDPISTESGPEMGRTMKLEPMGDDVGDPIDDEDERDERGEELEDDEELDERDEGERDPNDFEDGDEFEDEVEDEVGDEPVEDF